MVTVLGKSKKKKSVCVCVHCMLLQPCMNQDIYVKVMDNFDCYPHLSILLEKGSHPGCLRG